MVQLQNPDRLTQKIQFGTINDQDYDINGALNNTFVPIGHVTLCGRWHLSTGQVLQMAGIGSDNFIVICHHRSSYEGITHAQLGNQIYKVTHIELDSFRNQTAYDQITLSKVGDQNA
ncbi:head-tail adaptor protein [Lactobacillus xujianguonis]|uniref:Head-tail adaptor protein n=2 Tax=Lactobacillaceae TaxID=33958 RepID=A0A437SYF1_9LACO|nr:head-tail adaptor protein [Lactobacillus xujianguonis]